MAIQWTITVEALKHQLQPRGSFALDKQWHLVVLLKMQIRTLTCFAQASDPAADAPAAVDISHLHFVFFFFFLALRPRRLT